MKKNFQGLKSHLSIYILYKAFAGVTDFPKFISDSYEHCKIVRNFLELHRSSLRVPRVVGKFCELRKVVGKFYELHKVIMARQSAF